MTVEWIVVVAGLIFLLSTLLGVLGVFSSQTKNVPLIQRTVRVLICIAQGLLLAWFCLRWHHYADEMQSGWFVSFPVTTLYESIVFMVMTTGVFALALGRRIQVAVMTSLSFVFGIALCALGLSGVNAQPVLFLPSLKSYWLTSHVVLTFIAYAMFLLLAVMAAFELKRKDKVEIDFLMSSLLIVSFSIFTIGGIILGAIWAHSSWGRFWGWDPKETWALITWIAYAILLHLHVKGRLSKRQLCLALLFNFGIVLFTFLGVNLFFAGLHSYASA